MATPPLSPDLAQEALDALAACGGNQTEAARTLGLNLATYKSRLKAAETRGFRANAPQPGWTHSKEYPLQIDTGTIVVFSDAHYQPGEPSLAHRALLEVIKETKPRAIVANGDIFDGGSIGRHPPFGWATRPSPVQELEACIERMGDVELARPKGCELVYTIGNHDLRWERTLATQVDQFAGLQGLRLADHFGNWEMAWACPVNWETNGATMIKHRFASSGIHAAYNATLKGGVHTVSGHTHQLEVKCWGDYRGRRYGVQTGSLADLHGPQFEYHEQNPSPACAGFAVLTYHEGELVHPELCEVKGHRAWFRGKVVAGD